ncbi:tripartite tricarboxylate transporter substrate binding protein [Alcaligenaceae bacterium]|nr:tripartite tricarboxylate transporter substrate binding protein [Alcaligenaceae bacterium]
MLKKMAWLAGLVSLCVLPTAYASTEYPSRPVSIVVAYPPGGGIDTLARLVSIELTKRLDQSVVVLNKPGAAGSIGTAGVARAAPDGYTFVLSGANAILSPLVDPNLSFRIQDFEPVARLTETPYSLAISPDLKVGSLKELIALSKDKPGQLNFASTGQGSVQHLLGELLKQRAEIDWMHVPYQGGGPALRELAAGRVHIMFSNPIPLAPYLKEGTIQVAGVATDERISLMPDIPTFGEQGIDDFDVKTWVGLLAPAGTPEAIRKRVSDEVQHVLALPEIREAIEQQGSIVSFLPVEKFAEFLERDEERWKRIIDQSKFSSTM